MESRRVNSILAADFGSVHTRAVLIDVVDGTYRLVARGQSRTTDGFPANDIAIGFDRALRQLTEATERRFMADAGVIITPEQPDRSGVDFFALTASLGRPLRAVMIGLTPEVSIASALRAAEGTYIDVAAIISLDDGRSEEERLNAIILSMPDILILAGGTDGGAHTAPMQLAELAQLAISLMDPSRRPTVVVAGNASLAEQMTGLFEDLTSVLPAENVRPELEEERLDSARMQVGRAFDRYKEARSESFAMIGAMSHTGVLPTASSYNVLAEYLGTLYPGGVALVDVGSAASTLATAVEGQVRTSIRTDLGLGHSAPMLLEAVDVEAVRRWLPFEIPDNMLENYVINKSLRPATIPASAHDVYLEHALLKCGIRAMLTRINPDWEKATPPLELAIGAGAALTGTGHPAYDALLLLDALQPAGVTVLQADPYGLLPAMGTVAYYNPEAVVQLIDTGSLVTLGTSFSAAGLPRADKPAMRVRITVSSGEVVKNVVYGGHVWIYPLPLGKTARVQISCLSGMSMNGKRRVKLNVNGGLAGLIFDARGRPLPLAVTLAERAMQLPLWVSEVTGDPPLEIEPVKTTASDGRAQAAGADRRRRGLFGGRKRDEGHPEDSRRSRVGERDDVLDEVDDDELSELRKNVLS
jgi:hypothetical protein